MVETQQDRPFRPRLVVEHAPPALTRPRLKLRRILVAHRRKPVVDRVIRALRRRTGVYVKDGLLVRVVDTAMPGKGIKRERTPPRVEPLPLPSLSEEICECAAFFRTRFVQGEERTERINPPQWVAESVNSRRNFPGLRVLRGVVETPTVRPDGTVLQTPGYDADTGLLYAPSDVFPHIPDELPMDIVQASRDELLEVVCDFPFKDPVHRSAWLAGLLTLFGRHAYDGFTPFFLIDGNIRGSGKSLLVDAAALIATGRSAARTTQAPDDIEEEKRITSIALAGDPLILVDNINKPFGSGVLDASLTGEEWKGRVLATNTMPRIRMLTVWWGTGCNVRFRQGVDTSRRTLHIRLESDEERPEKRDGFRHPKLLRWARSQRTRLAAAAVIVLSAYLRQRKPDELRLAEWGSFEAWSECIRGCVVWLGLPDPFLAHEAMVSSVDVTTSSLEDLLEGWQELCAEHQVEDCTIRQALAWLREDDEYKRSFASHRLRFERLRSALSDLVRTRGGALPDAREVGYLFRSYEGRVLGGRRLRANKKVEAGIPWTVETLRS